MPPVSAAARVGGHIRSPLQAFNMQHDCLSATHLRENLASALKGSLRHPTNPVLRIKLLEDQKQEFDRTDSCLARTLWVSLFSFSQAAKIAGYSAIKC